MNLEMPWIESETQRLKLEQAKQQKEAEITGQKEEVKVLSPRELLVNRDVERLGVIEAEVQKKLTKAAGFFSG
jgi:hypothetical protein